MGGHFHGAVRRTFLLDSDTPRPCVAIEKGVGTTGGGRRGPRPGERAQAGGGGVRPGVIPHSVSLLRSVL
jgi:hypothetical protein